MDLLRQMAANRQAQGITATATKPKTESHDKPVPGTKAMRAYIVEKKPSKKCVKEHLEQIIAQECESSSDED